MAWGWLAAGLPLQEQWLQRRCPRGLRVRFSPFFYFFLIQRRAGGTVRLAVVRQQAQLVEGLA